MKKLEQKNFKGGKLKMINEIQKFLYVELPNIIHKIL